MFGLLLVALLGSSADLDREVRPFLAQHCIECHSGDKPKSGLDLTGDLDLEGDPELWEELIALITTGDMPPPERPRPDPAEAKRVGDWLSGELARLQGISPAAPVPIKRLTRTEYRNAIRDLFGIDYPTGERFPADEVGDGFDNIADLLSLSPLLFEKYLDAAEQIARQVVYDRATDTPAWVEYDAEALQGRGRGQSRSRGARHMSTNGEVFVQHPVAVPGRYRVRARAYGQQAGPEVVRMAFTLEGERKEEFEVPAVRSDPGDYTADYRLEAGERSIGVAFINDYWDPDNPDRSQRDRNAGVFQIAVTGPLDAPVLPGYQARWLPEPLPAGEWRTHLQPVLTDLMARAFRRPVAADEVKRLLDTAGELATDRDSLESRWRTAIATVLVSPDFLLRTERKVPEGRVRTLDGHELATRLSFFLWSSIPDRALLEAAGSGELLSNAGLRQQVRRLLNDARARALATNFAQQWLQIRALGETRPDAERYPTASPELLEAMRQESLALFETVLRERRSVWTLIDADFTFVNDALADHYGLPAVNGAHLRRVPLPEGERGGLLRHGSVLTTTSTPTRPSPVLRGKWILEVLLDAAPPPPPPDISSLVDAAAKDAHSLREQLELHRADPQCSTCHARMDALGFGLQNFDAIGRFRESEGRRPIDASGVLPDGRELSGADGLRGVLLGDPGFLRSLSRNLLTYALGRRLTPADRPLVDRLVRGLEKEPTLERLITDIALSDAFRKRASQ